MLTQYNEHSRKEVSNIHEDKLALRVRRRSYWKKDRAMSTDLFTPVVSESAQHPNFRNIHKQPNVFNCDVLNDWARGFPDRDGKFVKEFQTTFDSSLGYECHRQ